jgi:nucleoside-diphosphate-sugar epimerase
MAKLFMQNISSQKPITIFITGGAGYVGAMLIDLFSKRPDVARIIALDKEPLPDFIKDAPKLKYIVGNTSDGENADGKNWQKIVAAEQPDVVIHTAWQIREMYSKKPLQWRWNVKGSDAVFDFAFSTPSVKKLIHFSTVASYGARKTNTIEHRFTEDESFRTSDYLYAEEKRIVEDHLKIKYHVARNIALKAGAGAGGKSDSVVAAHACPQVAIIRPAAITGPRGRYMRIRFGLQSALSGQLKATFIQRLISLMVSFVPITPRWCRQFIHEDDIADIVSRLTFGDLVSDYDAFNACPLGDVVTGKDMAEAVGKKTISIPPWLIRIAFFIMWNGTLGRVPTSRGGWKSYSYPIAVDGSKLTRMYGYQYRWLSKEAFVKKEGRYANYINTTISK